MIISLLSSLPTLFVSGLTLFALISLAPLLVGRAALDVVIA